MGGTTRTPPSYAYDRGVRLCTTRTIHVTMVIVQHRTPHRMRTNSTDPVAMNIVNIVSFSYPLSDQYESYLPWHD